jgi:hypothetical protein
LLAAERAHHTRCRCLKKRLVQKSKTTLTSF